MLQDILKREDYYLDKLSMFLRGCNGVPEQFSMLITILDELDDVYDDVIESLNIVNTNVDEKTGKQICDEVFLNTLTEAESNTVGLYVDFLTKIGNLFGIYQNFTLSYVDEHLVRQEITVNLTPFEFWLLIKGQILQNCYDGTYAQSRAYYDKMKLPVYIFTDSNQATALVVLNSTSSIIVGNRAYQISDNIKHLFKAQYFTIKSMGITYNYLIDDLANLGVWDAPSSAEDHLKGWAPDETADPTQYAIWGF